MSVTFGDATRGAIDTLQAVDDMYQIGRAIGADDPCNPINILETLMELVIELIKDFIDGVIKLAGIAGKNSLFLILAILQETYGPSILLGLQGAVGFLSGNLIGVLLQGVAMLMAQVDGIMMIIMYLAAGACMSALEQRQGFVTQYFMNPINHIIHVLQLLDQLELTFDDPYSEDYARIKEAYEKVRQASVKLGIEVDKRISEGEAFLDVNAIEEVRALITEAIDLLLDGRYTEMMDQVNEALGGLDITQGLNLNLNMQSTDWSGGENHGAAWNIGNYSANWTQPSSGWTGGDGSEGSQAQGGDLSTISDFWNMLDAMGKSLYNVDHSSEALSGSVSYDFATGEWSNTISGQGAVAVSALLDDMITQFDPMFQAISYLQLVKIDLAEMSKKTPIQNRQMSQMFDIVESIAKEHSATQFSGAEGIFGSSANFSAEGGGADFLSNTIGALNSPDLVTLQSSNNKVRLTESAVTMLKFNLTTISMAGGMLEAMIRPLFNTLKGVRTDMKAFIDGAGGEAGAINALSGGLLSGENTQGFGFSPGNSSGSTMWDIGTQKLNWSLRLEGVSAGLMSFTTTLQLPGGQPVNWLDNDIAEQVEVRWDQLVAYLENSGGDVWLSADRYKELQPADVAFEMLQEIPAAVFQDLGGYGGAQFGGSGSQFASQIMPDVNSLAEGEPARGLLLAYMQELKTQFSHQHQIDYHVHSECQAIRTLIEQHPGFQQMMAWWDGLTNSLTDGPLAALGPELAEGSLDALAGAMANTSSILENPMYRNLGPCIKSGIVPPTIIGQGLGLDPIQIPDLSAQLNADKLAQQAAKLQSDALKGIAGVTDNAKWQEFEKQKRELMTNMSNQASQLTDVITQLGIIYNIVSG